MRTVMVTNPLILFRNWLLTLEIKHSDKISSEILCGLYLWQEPGSSFRIRYDKVDEHLLEEGSLTALLDAFISDVLVINEDLYTKHAALNFYGTCALQLLNYGEEISGETLQELHIGFLVNDQRELADFVESKMNTSVDPVTIKSRKIVKDSWDKFSAEQFNFQTLHDFFMSKPSERG